MWRMDKLFENNKHGSMFIRQESEASLKIRPGSSIECNNQILAAILYHKRAMDYSFGIHHLQSLSPTSLMYFILKSVYLFVLFEELFKTSFMAVLLINLGTYPGGQVGSGQDGGGVVTC